MTYNNTMTILAGIGVMALIAITIFQVPAFLLLGIMFLIAMVVSEFDFDTPYEQHLRREQEHSATMRQRLELPEYIEEIGSDKLEVFKEPIEKTAILQADTRRNQLLADLGIIGYPEHTIEKLRMSLLNTEQIKNNLDKGTKAKLTELREFLT